MFLAALVCLFCLASCTGDVTDEKVRIAVIAKSTQSDFWHNVFAGVNSAATEYNAEVTIAGPTSEEDYVTQNNMIERAFENGADAIVLSAIDYNKSTSVVEKAIAGGVRVVMIDSDINSDKTSLFIGTDNYEAGRMAAEAAIEQSKQMWDGAAGYLYVGIVNYDENSDNGQQREKGFRDRLSEQSDVKIVSSINVASTVEDATNGAKTMLEEHPEINVIAGFNEYMTLGVGYAVQLLERASSVCAVGFDSNVVSIGMLETGEMDALVVQNPFAMGYLGVKNAYELASGKKSGEDTLTTNYCITKQNMYDESSQKILFKFD